MSLYPIVLLWLTCGMIGAGFNNAWRQRSPRWRHAAKDDKWSDWGMSVALSILGPAWLAMSLVEYGWSEGWSLVPGCGVDEDE